MWPITCKKLRRSVRLMTKDKDETKHQPKNFGDLGYFEFLPTELMHRIFNNLSAEDLSILTICSKIMRNLIENYNNSPAGLHQLIFHKSNEKSSNLATFDMQNDHINSYHKLGLLMKRSTCLYPTKDRLRIILEFMKKLKFTSKGNISNACHYLKCFGQFAHTVIAGWDESECHFAHSVLENVNHMKKYVSNVLQSVPGTHPNQEMYIRLYYRFVYLDSCRTPADRCFWLSCLLKPLPFVHQAKFLYLLFGPVNSEKIMWWILVETSPLGIFQVHNYLLELAQAIQLLQKSNSDWTEDDIISLLEELTDTPEEWLAENVATLLFLCGDAVTIMFMGNKLLNGKVVDLGTLVTNLALVCTKQNCNMQWLIRTVECVCRITANESDRRKFIQMIPSTFSEFIFSLSEISDIDEDRESELRLLVETQNSFLSAIIMKAFGKLLGVSDILTSEE